MASFRFFDDCQPVDQTVDLPDRSDGYNPTLPRPIRQRPVSPELIFNRDTIAQLRQSAQSGAVLEEVSRVAPEAARSPGPVSPLAVLGFFALAVYLAR